jgi:hypothetical protein
MVNFLLKRKNKIILLFILILSAIMVTILLGSYIIPFGGHYIR